MIGAGRVSQMMFDRHKPDLTRVDADLFQHAKDLAHVAAVTAVPVKQSDERPVRCMPMPQRVMPAGRTPNTHRSEWIRHHLHIRRLDAGLSETKARRPFGLESLGVFVPGEPFLLRCRHDSPVHHNGRRRVVTDSTTQTQYNHAPVSWRHILSTGLSTGGRL